MRINRTNVLSDLKEFVSKGNCIIIGRPGVGKSYLIADLCDEFDKDSVPNLFIQIDRLGNATPDELKEELKFEGDLIDKIYSEFRKTKNLPGVLIFDGFDATRNDLARVNILKLIERALLTLKDICHVIVTVRTYDAHKSQELIDLFGQFSATDTPKYRETNILCRHFAVPVLDDSEIEQAITQIPNLNGIYQTASSDLKELLRIPFNLWLLEKILTVSTDFKEISAIRSEIQLLNLFWHRRIKSKKDSDERELILSYAAKDMVKERILSAKKEILFEKFEGKYSETWTGLLSDEILIQVSSAGQRIAFSHNILFDYAVCVLLIEDIPEKFVEFVSEDIARPIFLRPSILFYFARLWYEARDIFWHIFEYILSKDDINLRLIARFMPTRIIVSEIHDMDEITPLFKALETEELKESEAILRILQAHKALNITNDALWANVLERASRNIKITFAWDLAVTITAVLDRAENNNIQELKRLCGIIGRNLFKWVWQQRLADVDRKNWYESLGANLVVPLVARTFETNSEESYHLLAEIPKLIGATDFSISYIFRLVDKIDYIWAYNPEFIVTLYLKVFGHEESSEQTTPMGTPIMPMSSTRRQDYHMCWYILIKKFPKFLKAAPMYAIRAAILTLNTFIIEQHVIGYLREGVKIENSVQEFAFHGGMARYLPDASFIWDESQYKDEPIEMADSLFAYIEEIATDKGKAPYLDSILDIFRDNAIVAFFWKHLLKSASQLPNFFASRVFDLVIAKPILTNDEVIYELGLFLESGSYALTQDQLDIMEKTILQLPKTAEDDGRLKYLTRRQKRLLARIPIQFLMSDEAQKIRRQMEDEKTIPENKPLATFTSWSGPYTYKERFKEEGIDIEDPKISAIVSYYEPLGRFESEWQNAKPTIEAIVRILPMLTELFIILTGTTIDKESVLEGAWTKLTACCRKISYTLTDPESDTFKFIRKILLLGAKHKSPEPDAEYDASFTSPSWSPAPRIEAAQGLPWIALRQPDSEILLAIETLVKDKVPRVRFLIVEELWRISNKAPELFWELAKYLAENENNQVVQRALCHTLSNIIGPKENEDRSTVLFEILLRRALSKGAESEIIEPIVDMALRLYLVRNNAWGFNTLNIFLTEPFLFDRELKHATSKTFSYLEPTKGSEIIDRSIKWLSEAIDAAEKGLIELRDEHKGGDIKFKELYGVIDEIVMWLSIDFHAKTTDSANNRKEYYFKIKPLLEKILTFALNEKHGILASTAHHFMELLRKVASFDPAGVLHLAAGVAGSSKKAGYNLDSMAIGEVVKLVESLLADHREVLREEESLTNLIALLDIFAEAGWPEALNLIWRLDEVFR